MKHLYEHRSQPLISRQRFARRVWQHFLLAVALLGVSLVAGMMGYHFLAGLRWVDAFLNSAMLLGGMGQVGDIPTQSGKIFAGIFALYAGLVLIVASAVLLTPLLHRLMHRVHLEGKS